MTAPNVAQSSNILATADYGHGVSTNAEPPVPPEPPLKSEQSQASRALGLASYFLGGCMSINASQVLGTPLYLINKDWYNTWIAFTKQSWGLLTMTMTQWWAPTVVRVSGDSSMRGQLLRTTDGGLMCNFPERMVLVANHQIYTDWLYLWWIGYAAGMHGRIYVVLKESLKRIPVIGWGMQFAQFIFLKRHWEEDKPGLAKHMQRLNNSKDPMWLMMFPEGTNLASCTRETSRKWAQKNGIPDMKHTLIPRSTGLQFMVQELKETVEYVYDCTIAYEGVPHGSYAQDIFTVGASYFGGRPPKSVNMYWRRFRVNSIPVDDPKRFELWLRLRWREKDRFIDHYLKHGRFPADEGSNHNFQGELVHGAGHIEADIRPKYWYEFMQVFAPIAVFALVLYFIYGALPQEMVKSIKSVDQKTVMKNLEAIQRGEMKVPETKDLFATAPKELRDKYAAVQKFAAQQNKSPEQVIAEVKKTMPAGVLPAGDPGPKPKPTKVAAPPVLANKSADTASPSQKVEKPLTSPSKAAQKPVVPSAKKLPPTKRPEAKDNSNVKSATPTAGCKPSPSAAVKPKANTPSPKKPLAKTKLPAKAPGSGVKKVAGPKPPASASKPQPAAVQSPAANTDAAKPTDKDAVRHALKKDMRKGKQEPVRKIRRALQESSVNS